MATNTVSYFPLSQLHQEIDDTLTGAVRFNAEQELSETQKAQARNNIGAASFGSILTILGHYNTVEALQANGEQKVGNAYSVGASVPYKLYIFDGMTESWLDYGYIRSQDINARCVQNVAIAKSAWSQDTTALSGYSYKARITLADSTVDSFPIVVFESEQAFSGNFAPMSFAFAGYLEVFAKSIPTKDINIVTATVIVGGGAGKGITNASATIADGSVTRAKLAQDALYSPTATFNSNRAIALTDLGKTLWPQWSSAGATYILSLTANISSALPVGFEVAIAYIISNCKVQISVSGVRMVHAGDGQIVGRSETKTLTIPEIGNMIALKKFDTQSSAGDLWVVTGNVEVVT